MMLRSTGLGLPADPAGWRTGQSGAATAYPPRTARAAVNRASKFFAHNTA